MHKPKANLFLIVNKTNDGYAEIFVYGYIGDSWSEEGVTAAAFTKELRKLEKEYSLIKVRINSGGGSVFDGIAMFNAIRQCKVDTEAYIDGVAASMAMPLAFACKKVYISKFSHGMSHRVTGGGYGNADDMRQTAKLMEDLEGNIAEIIAERTGLTPEAAKKKYLNNSDRWINAQEALKEGLVDGIYDGEQVDAPKNSATAMELMNNYNTVLLNKLNTDTTETIILI